MPRRRTRVQRLPHRTLRGVGKVEIVQASLQIHVVDADLLLYHCSRSRGSCLTNLTPNSLARAAHFHS